MRGADVPDATAQELKRLKPEKAILIDSDCATEQKIESLKRSIGKTCCIETVSERDCYELSRSVFRYGETRSLWGTRAAIADEGCLADMVSVSPLLYSEKIPMLLFNGDMPLTEEDLSAICSNEKISSCIYVGESKQSCFDSASPLPVAELRGTGPCDTNRVINEWIEEREGIAPLTKYCVIAFEDLEYALCVGAFAARKGMKIVLTNPNNLDSMAYTIRYLESMSDPRPSLCFLGSSLAFSDYDKGLLLAVAARGGR